MSEALPPSARSRAAVGLKAGATRRRLELQGCGSCGAVQYPPREACQRCLSTQLVWQAQSGAGELLAETRLFHSNHEFFRMRLPWRIGLIRLDCGPTVIAHLHECVPPAAARVRVEARLDKSAQAALIALPVRGRAEIADDRQLRELLES